MVDLRIVKEIWICTDTGKGLDVASVIVFNIGWTFTRNSQL